MITVPKGYLQWDASTLAHPLTLAGIPLASPLEALSWERQADVSLLTAQDGSTIAQSILAGPDAPVGRSPFQARVRASLVAESDYQAMERAAALCAPVDLWPGWWHVDVWNVAVGGPGRTLWRTSRRLAETLPAGAGLEPVATLDGAPLVVVPGTPGDREIRLPDVNDGPHGHNALLETPDLTGAAELLLSYPAEYRVVIAELRRSVPAANRLVVELDLVEHLPARFSDF